jgi:IS30 family transposase
MEKGYRQISLEERDRIAEMKSLGHTVTEIAMALGRSKSTLSRELRRNATPAYKVYLSHRAHERAITRKQEAGSYNEYQSILLKQFDKFLIVKPAVCYHSHYFDKCPDPLIGGFKKSLYIIH